jgi:hypothetical protein
MGRKIKAKDAQTGRMVDVDAEAVGLGPIRHESLPDPLLRRVRSIHGRIRDVYGVSLEQFEVGFMRDAHPEREVAVWERIVEALGRVEEALPTLDRSVILRTLLAHSIGAMTPAEQADPTLSRIIAIADAT